MRASGQHLPEERLFHSYLSVLGGEILDPPVAEHLTDCAECGQRYADLVRFMDWLDTEAVAETDEVFTTERLRQQRAQIARKLEHLGHPARVITFPGRPGSHRTLGATPRPARRWIAAAAAAGLIVGVGTGLFFDWDRVPGRRIAGARKAVLTTTGRLDDRQGRMERMEIARPDPSDDTVFLSEIELAGERPNIRELAAVDALTPHAREITLR